MRPTAPKNVKVMLDSKRVNTVIVSWTASVGVDVNTYRVTYRPVGSKVNKMVRGSMFYWNNPYLGSLKFWKVFYL